MAVFKCKLCGGTIEISENGIGVCDSCGTKQTIPNTNDEKKMNLLDRANHFRMQNDFDKALAIYEQVLDEDATDSDVYYSIALCRYGITYVDDPKTKKKVPTINRMQNKSFLEDTDFLMAIKNANPEQAKFYDEEGQYIDKVQQSIMDITKKEKPYDVFICYKETDENGNRTYDSVYANDLYDGLTKEGFKVFFARITLEDKLGTAYEPYIFSALNSSKVMVVIGTKKEYMNAAWVKNEWSRFLSLIGEGKDKVLIPAYKDMDPYDLPDEFANLQAQDMSKLGFMQDLIRGIKKIISNGNESDERNGISTNANKNSEINLYLKRVKIFLNDGDYESANDYCERVLDIDPENADAYIYKLMIEATDKDYRRIRDLFDKINGKYINYFCLLLDGVSIDDIYLEHCSCEYYSDLRESKNYNNAINFCKDEEKLKKLKEVFNINQYEYAEYILMGNIKNAFAKVNQAYNILTSIKGYKNSDEIIQFIENNKSKFNYTTAWIKMLILLVIGVFIWFKCTINSDWNIMNIIILILIVYLVAFIPIIQVGLIYKKLRNMFKNNNDNKSNSIMESTKNISKSFNDIINNNKDKINKISDFATTIRKTVIDNISNNSENKNNNETNENENKNV